MASPAATPGVSPEFQTQFEALQRLVLETRTLVGRQQQFESQLHENSMVREELEAVREGEAVYKLHGKVLVRQELAEARATVESRLKLITAEVAKTERAIKDAMGKQDSLRAALQGLSRQAQAQPSAGSPQPLQQ